MHHKAIPTEKCYQCEQANQIVYNRREVQTRFGIQRVCLCDACHKIQVELPTSLPREGKMLVLISNGTQIRATEKDMQRLLRIIGT